VATTAEMLTAVNTAIHNLMTGGAVQSYEINGRNIRYFSLKELQDLRSQLQQEVASESGSRNYVTFKNPS
jgi:hypothetical protein